MKTDRVPFPAKAEQSVDTTGVYLREMGRTSVMTREDEQRVGKRMADGRAAVSIALAASPAALRELAAVGAKVRTQAVTMSDVSDAADEPDFVDTVAEDAMLAILDAAVEAKRLTVDQFHALRLNAVTIQGVVAALRTRMKRKPTPDLERTLAAVDHGLAEVTIARNEFVSRNLRLVFMFAKQRQHRGLSLMDLVQEGSIGLLKAADKFDYTRGHKFATYSVWWIRQAMDRSIDDTGRSIRLPVHFQWDRKRIGAARNRLEQRGEPVTPESIAVEADRPLAIVQNVLKYWNRIVSLSAPIGDEDDGEMGDVLPDDQKPADDVASERQLEARVDAVVEALPPREQEVMRRRFGIGRKGSETLDEIGQDFQVSRERIRQIETIAFKTLMHPARSKPILELAHDFGMRVPRRFAAQ